MFKRSMAVLAALGALVALATTATPAQAASDGVWDYRAIGISGTYQTFVGDFNGDGAADIFFYAPGTTGDSLWLGRAGVRGASGFTKRAFNVNGSYQPIVGDFAGDARTDIFWYAPGTAADSLWVNNGNGTFTSQAKRVDGSFRAMPVIDFTSGKDDVLWYNPSKTTSYRWRFSPSGDGTYESFAVGIPANAKVITGDWNGDGHEDAFALGASDKALYFTATDTGGTGKSFSISESYTPHPVWHVPSDGILWFGPGNMGDAFWRGTTGTNFTSVPLADIPWTGRLTNFGLDTVFVTGAGVDDVVFYDDGTTADWYYLNDGHEKGSERPIVGDFDGDDWLDVLWYAAGTPADELWYLEPSSGGAAPSGQDGTGRTGAASGAALVAALRSAEG